MFLLLPPPGPGDLKRAELAVQYIHRSSTEGVLPIQRPRVKLFHCTSCVCMIILDIKEEVCVVCQQGCSGLWPSW